MTRGPRWLWKNEKHELKCEETVRCYTKWMRILGTEHKDTGVPQKLCDALLL